MVAATVMPFGVREVDLYCAGNIGVRMLYPKSTLEYQLLALGHSVQSAANLSEHSTRV